MKSLVRQFCLRPTVVALAVLTAFTPLAAQAEDDEYNPLEASVSAGVGAVTGDRADRALYGQYNGMRKDDLYGLLDFVYSRRNQETGAWVDAYGSRLGLDTRELGFAWSRQGNWRAAANYYELTRVDPFSANTGSAGLGSTAPQVSRLAAPGTGAIFDLETVRKGLGASFSKRFGPAFALEASLKGENRDGARLFGIGMACPSSQAAAGCDGAALLLLPEPINQRHYQAETRLNYAGRSFGLSAGYYGSFFRNYFGTMVPSVSGNLNLPNPADGAFAAGAGLLAVLNNPVALPPNSDAHQLDLTGTYALNPSTRANFKLALGTARQDDDFAGAGLAGAPAGVANLGGRVDTKLGQVGLSARPLAKLALAADWRYEERDDKTPLAQYNVVDVFGNGTFSNRQYSLKKIRSKAQATYQLPERYSVTGGVDYEYIERDTFTQSAAVSGLSALRYETEELGYRLELRKQVTETFGGSIGISRADRDGSNWLRPASPTGVTTVFDNSTFGSRAVFAPTLADRKRDKIRAFGSWQATEALSLQLAAEVGKDEYTTPSNYALRDSKMNLVSLDATYVVSDEWSVNGYLSQGSQKLNQARPEGYVLAFDNKSSALGVGVNGKASDKLAVGGQLSFLNDKNTYAQSLDPQAGGSAATLLATAGGLPEIQYRRTELRVFGKYALSAASALRLDAVHLRSKYNDWSYGYAGTPFLYSDNTTVFLQEQQNVTFLGLTYSYAWR